MLIHLGTPQASRLRVKAEACVVGAVLGAAVAFFGATEGHAQQQFMLTGTISDTICALVVGALLFPPPSSQASQQRRCGLLRPGRTTPPVNSRERWLNSSRSLPIESIRIFTAP
jgi:hypothetical protein